MLSMTGEYGAAQFQIRTARDHILSQPHDCVQLRNKWPSSHLWWWAVLEHMHCHTYTVSIGKKGANKVALLIMKMLMHLDLLHSNFVGDGLNTISNNCTAKTKTTHSWSYRHGWCSWVITSMADAFGLVLQGGWRYLPCCWPHKNVADRLYNLQLAEARLLIFDEESLNIQWVGGGIDYSASGTVHPTVATDSACVYTQYRPQSNN